MKDKKMSRMFLEKQAKEEEDLQNGKKYKRKLYRGKDNLIGLCSQLSCWKDP